jgi:hypothetical protein
MNFKTTPAINAFHQPAARNSWRARRASMKSKVSMKAAERTSGNLLEQTVSLAVGALAF